MRCNSCRQTVDTYRLPHRRDSNRLRLVFAKGKNCGANPVRCDIRPRPTVVADARFARYSVAVEPLLTNPVRCDIRRRPLADRTKEKNRAPEKILQYAKDFWEEEEKRSAVALLYKKKCSKRSLRRGGTKRSWSRNMPTICDCNFILHE